jgi:catechol 2,3-dioxygenase-like lactoylglutathione lyase family enzyme
MAANFISSVIFVKDIRASRDFYEEILNQKIDNDFDLSIGYIGGFSIWQSDHAHETIFGPSAGDENPLGSKNHEFCFESEDLDELLASVTQANVPFVHPIVEQPWGQRVFRIYDPDGYIVELGEPMTAVVHRLLSLGGSVEEVTRRTAMPFDLVKAIAEEGPDGAHK